jgi:hypothetical protein
VEKPVEESLPGVNLLGEEHQVNLEEEKLHQKRRRDDFTIL